MATGKNIWCTLHWSEVMAAAHAGILRRVIDMREGLGYSAKDKPDKWWREIEGNCAEMVVAKVVLKCFWVGLVGIGQEERAKVKRFDVAGLQVRTTARLDGGLINYRGKDNPADNFVLVVGESPRFRVVGWMRGSEAQQDKYWNTTKLDPPAWLVPQCDLHELESLPLEEELEF